MVSLLAAATGDFGAICALLIVIGVSVKLGSAAQKVVEKGSFLKGFFLGNRGLGVWAMALTATVQSGGTFMGFPSLVFTHGWTVSLWIGSYMLVPLTGFAVLGKRLAQVSRRTGAITVPDLFRGRFDNSRIGLVASLLILFFLTFMMIANFKAGALVMKISLPGSETLSLSEEVPTAGNIAPANTPTGAAAASPTASPTGVAKAKPNTAKSSPLDRYYYIGLAVFSVTVVGYTLIGGFLASVWTDLFQSVLMWLGVVLLCTLVFMSHEVPSLQQATINAVQQTGDGYINFSGFAPDGREYLTVGLACSFFVVWIFGGMASPASVTRVMASSDTNTLRRSIFVLGVYNCFIYLPLIAICIAARTVFPDLPANRSDEIIPRMALWATGPTFGGRFVAGLILAAPFGAIMATVSTYLVVISSGIVNDVYHRFIHPEAGDDDLRRTTRVVMIVLGLVCVASNIYPPDYLQSLIIFCTSSGAASFLVPVMMTAYWRRATAAGATTAMLTGAITVLVLFVLGLTSPDPMIGPKTAFRPYFLLGIEPVVWGLLASAVAGVGVSFLTKPPPEDVIEKLFA